MPVMRDIGHLATCRAGGGQGEIHPVEDAAVAWHDGRIEWAGPEAELPEAWEGEPSLSARGGLVVPGLVDAHTHLAFGGWRADEFARRAAGESYAEIAASGGGIASTVAATRAASRRELAERASGFLKAMLSCGVTTVEAKSGYGLSAEEELKLLRVYRHLRRATRVRVVPTFLGAHAVPPERADDRDGLVEEIVRDWIPEVAGEGLARFCDVFVEEGAFRPAEARRVLEAGRRHGLAPKLHVDQLSDGGGAALAAELGAVSADHLEHVSYEGIEALAAADTVAVLLPLASLYLGQPAAPGRRMAEAGVPVAVATDFNPGTAPSHHLPTAMTLACVREGLSPAGALKGATLFAARAAGEEERIGSVEPGKAADLAVFDAPDVPTWLQGLGVDRCVGTVAGGEVAWSAPGRPLADGVR